MKEFQDCLTKLSSTDIDKLKNNESIKITLSKEEFEVLPSMVDIRVEAKEGFNATYKGNNFIVLNTSLSEELLNEGLARETVSKIQQIRKNNNYDIADRINVYYESSEEYTKCISDFVEFIKEETLAIKFLPAKNLQDSYEINEYNVKLKVERA